GGRRTGGGHLRDRLSHHDRAALLSDRYDLRLPPAPRRSRARHRPSHEAGAPPSLSLPAGTLMAPPKVVIRGLGKTFRTDPGEVVALAGVDLDVGENEFVALVGTSGCGKSTLLSIVAGLESMDQGAVTIDAEPITAPGLDRGVVFQSYTLLPWLTAE